MVLENKSGHKTTTFWQWRKSVACKIGMLQKSKKKVSVEDAKCKHNDWNKDHRCVYYNLPNQTMSEQLIWHFQNECIINRVIMRRLRNSFEDNFLSCFRLLNPARLSCSLIEFLSRGNKRRIQCTKK